MLVENKKIIHFPPSDLPKLMVVIDTEEEFDWSAEPNRAETSVCAMEHIGRAQEIFDEYGIVPCYVVDYPVASQPSGYSVLKEILQEGRCDIGAHLHPWVTPPFSEKLSRSNMYPGNLDNTVEQAKLDSLTNKIENTFSHRPVIYKAGRYGFGANTTDILTQLGYEIDLSFCPPVDYRSDGGPDYSDATAEPFWFGKNQQLLQIPITGGFVGFAGKFSKPIFNMASKLNRLKAVGIASRLGVVDRLMLSPEGFNNGEHVKLTKYLFNKGLRTFTWSFHSSSVMPGGSPYVQDEKSLRDFLNAFRRYFDFFFQSLDGVATTPTALKKQMEQCI